MYIPPPPPGRCSRKAPEGPRARESDPRAPRMASRLLKRPLGRPERAPRALRHAWRWFQEGPIGPQEGSKRPSQRAPGSQNRCIPFGKRACIYLYMSIIFAFSELPKSKTAKQAPEGIPRRLQRAPRRSKERPRQPKRAPRGPQGNPKNALREGRGALPLGAWLPKGSQGPPRILQDDAKRPPEAPESPPRGPERPPRGPAEASKRAEPFAAACEAGRGHLFTYYILRAAGQCG